MLKSRCEDVRNAFCCPRIKMKVHHLTTPRNLPKHVRQARVGVLGIILHVIDGGINFENRATAGLNERTLFGSIQHSIYGAANDETASARLTLSSYFVPICRRSSVENHGSAPPCSTGHHLSCLSTCPRPHILPQKKTTKGVTPILDGRSFRTRCR